MTFRLPPSDFTRNTSLSGIVSTMTMTIAEPSQHTNSITVVGTQFCALHPVDLIILRNVKSQEGGNLVVTDVNGNIVFKVKGTLLSLRDRHLLLDTNGDPLLSLQHKILSPHRRWQVFRGDSSDSKDLLFSVKKSSWIQSKSELDVFLAANTKEEVCDFKIKGSWVERSCIIYIGDSYNIIAQIHKEHSVQRKDFGKGSFTVTIYPNVDNAFIAALIFILNEINYDSNSND
ncbi:hypothetical protein NE237_004455 [Protea cynaroides]|uniref:Uncharacterized protein n=1 Tax=Protea cynaroides TaxID=273540 RepID=A0A9Q0KJG4_9MAGN|nr:hypothetical protein NE237_004455 [Protea cynaroides]